KDHGYQFISAHAMSQDYYFDDDLKEKFYRAIRRSFEACSMLGIPQIVVHGLNLWKPSDKNPETVFRVNREFYLRLADAAERVNVDMLAENFQADCSDGYPFTTGALMMDFLAKADIPRLHLNWDVGHANIDNPHLQYDDIIAMGSELRSIHVHDNWGNVDCHSIPFSSSVNFDQVIRGLIDTGYKGTFNLEASDLFVISNEEGRGRKRLCRNPGDKLSDPPKHIITAYYNLLYQMGKWMLDEYHLFEE
ncbi:MAG: sugar phosphate isomerase/epimerase, partial [Clostridia bacterium]|nr:sugar phosphate isomerase/epimerase [Clostridia bacterium]